MDNKIRLPCPCAKTSAGGWGGGWRGNNSNYNKVSIYINLALCSRETENTRDVSNLKITFPRTKKMKAPETFSIFVYFCTNFISFLTFNMYLKFGLWFVNIRGHRLYSTWVYAKVSLHGLSWEIQYLLVL